MRVLNTQQMREADRRTIEEIGIPSIVLMENAGRQVVAAMQSRFEELPTMRVAVLCGRGNNGGDGFVVARTLAEHHVDVGVYLVGNAADIKQRVALKILGRSSVDRQFLFAQERGWKDLNFIQTIGDDYAKDLGLLNADGSENPALVVFRRDAGKVRLFWASEMTKQKLRLLSR